MPSSTFFNLPEPKKEKIMDAVSKEISSYPYAGLSINRIIFSAGISRGSFYQYFEDKTDMYEYVINKYRLAFEENLLRLLRENGGDLFETFRCLVSQMAEYFLSLGERQRMFKYIFEYLKDSPEGSPSLVQSSLENCFRIYRENTDASSFVFEDGRRLRLLIEILSCCAVQTIAQIISCGKSRSAAINDFAVKLDMIKFGCKIKEDK